MTTSPPERGWMNAGELREALAGLDDDAPIFVDGNPDRSVTFAYPTDQIHPDDVSTREKGDRLVRGLEIWLEDIDDRDAVRQWPDTFGDQRCRHSSRAPFSQAQQEAREALGRLFDQAYNTAGDFEGRRRANADHDTVLKMIDREEWS